MAGRGVHHVDLAVCDVDRSLAFYLDLLGPLGWVESDRWATYRGSEQVVYLDVRCMAAGARITPLPRAIPTWARTWYYAFFVFDPDGFRIEVFCWPRADGEPEDDAA